jgi:hypothetical protein
MTHNVIHLCYPMIPRYTKTRYQRATCHWVFGIMRSVCKYVKGLYNNRVSVCYTDSLFIYIPLCYTYTRIYAQGVYRLYNIFFQSHRINTKYYFPNTPLVSGGIWVTFGYLLVITKERGKIWVSRLGITGITHG